MKQLSGFFLLSLLKLYFSSPLIQAQENNNWYFGWNAGISFESGSATALTDGQIYTIEGVATISDIATGDLLFYSDGLTVWNKNHDVMAGGTGLLGHENATHAITIVPNPDFYTGGLNSHLFYLFTNDFKNSSNGFRYSIVDLSANDGNGEVIEKNTLILSQNTERCTAIHSCEAGKIWVMTKVYGNDEFLSIPIISSGIQLPDMVSSFTGSSTNINNDKVGVLKSSPSGDAIAMAFLQSDKVEYYPFDRFSGLISPATYTFSGVDQAYGIEFSPDGNRLYIANFEKDKSIYQYDITSDNPELSQEIIHTTPDYIFGQMQLGPDGKIYLSRGIREDGVIVGVPSLAVINNPNEVGASCNFQEDAFYLAGNYSKVGLPNFVRGIPYPTIEVDLLAPESICADEELILSPSSAYEYDSYLWQDGSTLSTLEVSDAGFYSVTVTAGCSTDSDSVYVDVIPLAYADLGNDTTICSAPLSLGIDHLSTDNYLWSTGDTSPQITVSESGFYQITVSNICGSDEDEIEVMFEEPSPESGILLIPSAFSPNNDGINDFLEISTPSENVFDFLFIAYDRWGNRIFESDDPDFSWDGSYPSNDQSQAAELSVVAYYCTATVKVGCNEEETITQKGNITILR